MSKQKSFLNKALSLMLCCTFLVSSIVTGRKLDYQAVTGSIEVGEHSIPIAAEGMHAVGVTPEKDFPGAMELPVVGMTPTWDVPPNTTWTLVAFGGGGIMEKFSADTYRDARPVSDDSVIAYLFAHIMFNQKTIVNLVGGKQAASYYDSRMDILKGFVATDPVKFGPAIMKTCQDGMSTAQVDYYSKAAAYIHQGTKPEIRIRYNDQEPIVDDSKDYYLYGPVTFLTDAVYDTSNGCFLDYEITSKLHGNSSPNAERPTLSTLDGIEVMHPEFNTNYYIKVKKALGYVDVTINLKGKFLQPDLGLLYSSSGKNIWVAPVYTYVDLTDSATYKTLGKCVTLRIHRLDTSNNYTRGQSIVTIHKPDGSVQEVTLDNGFVEITDMPLGSNYVFRETKAPDGYEQADQVTMNINNDKTTINVWLQAPKYTVEQQFKVISDTFDLLPNIRIDVYKDGALFDTRWTNEKGIATFKLPYGNYTYKQVTAHEGYTPNYTEKAFSVENQNPRDIIVIENKIIKGSITIVNLDMTTEEPIWGAVYQLHRVESDGTMTFIDELTTHASSANVFEQVHYGNYVVTQITPPPDYKQTAGRQSVSIKVDNLHQTLIFKNSIEKGEITVRVVDDKGYPVPNASISVFSVIKGVAREIYKVETTVNGEISLPGLNVGQYKIRLNTVDPKYTIGLNSEDVERVITLTPTHFRETVEFNVATTIGSLQIDVYDVENNNLVPGARYEVRNDALGIVRSFSTNGTQSILLEDLPYGEYTIRQVEAPAGYFEDTSEYKIRIEYDEHCAKQIIYLSKYTGSVKVICKDDFGNPVVGATFEILKDDSNEPAGSTRTTNSSGEVIFPGLEQGTYTVIQKTAPAGWYQTNLTGKGYVLRAGDMSIVEIFNARVKGSITVMKLDSISKKPIEGAILGLFDHDTDMLYKAVSSNASGKAIFEDIPAGDYYIWEIKPAFGYLHNTKILADNAGCVRTHQPRGYSDILYTMGVLSNQSSNKTASKEVNLFASLFHPVEFSALTIDSNNPNIIVDENGNISSSGGNNNNTSTVPPVTTPPSNENNNNNSSSSNEPIVSPGTPINPPSNNNNNSNTNTGSTPSLPDDIISEGDKIYGSITVSVLQDNNILNGINVHVRGSNNYSRVQSTSNGSALFTGLELGTYYVDLFDSVSGYSRPATQTITLMEQNYIQSTQLTTTKLAKSSINVKVTADDSDADLEGLQIVLLDENKNKLQSIKTDSRGRAYFENLNNGSYYVEFNDSLRNYDLKSNERVSVSLSTDENKTVEFEFESEEENKVIVDKNVDFGNVGTYSTVTGRLWKDLNSNGKFDSNELPITGRQVAIKNNGTIVATAITDSNGVYSTSVAPGVYFLTANMGAGEAIVESTSQARTLDNSTMSQVGTATLDVAAGDSITISGGVVDADFVKLPPTGELSLLDYTLLFILSVAGLILSAMYTRKVWSK